MVHLNNQWQKAAPVALICLNTARHDLSLEAGDLSGGRSRDAINGKNRRSARHHTRPNMPTMSAMRTRSDKLPACILSIRLAR